MTVTSVSTYGSLQNLLQNVSQAQNSLNNDQIAISSGHASQTFDGISGSVEQLTALNSQMARLTNFAQSNAVVTSQLQATNTSLGQMQQIATGIVSLIASQTSGVANSAASFKQQLQNNLAALTGQLNSTFQGNYLFSGTATHTAPIKSPLPTTNTVGVADNFYYQGSNQNSSLRVSDSQTIPTHSIRADNAAFQQIFAGITQALQDGVGTEDLKKAQDLVNNGVQSIIALQASVNANMVNVQQIDSQNQTLSTYYTGLSQNITQSDVVALSTKVAQDQTVLEASFSTFARISSLSLANYLK